MISPFYKLDENNNPVPCKYDEMMCMTTSERARVAETQFDSETWVSTVFLGMNANPFSHWSDRPPVLWETMIFGGSEAGYCRRYASHADALEGHKETLAMLRAGGVRFLKGQ